MTLYSRRHYLLQIINNNIIISDSYAILTKLHLAAFLWFVLNIEIPFELITKIPGIIEVLAITKMKLTKNYFTNTSLYRLLTKLLYINLFICFTFSSLKLVVWIQLFNTCIPLAFSRLLLYQYFFLLQTK